MKIALKHQATQKTAGSVISVREYPLNHDMLDLAIATISGRYPETGRVVNQQSNELAYVNQGEGKIVVNGKEHQLTAGDALIIEAGEPYYWEGSFQLVISCQPVWSIEQHKVVD